jgi:hypothetical protein
MYSNGRINANPHPGQYAEHATQRVDIKQTQCGTANSADLLTIRYEAEKSVNYHRELAEKYDQAAAFFRDNPAFDEFVRLIRSGAIQI